jgi:hypothetical protein
MIVNRSPRLSTLAADGGYQFFRASNASESIMWSIYSGARTAFREVQGPQAHAWQGTMQIFFRLSWDPVLHDSSSLITYPILKIAKRNGSLEGDHVNTRSTATRGPGVIIRITPLPSRTWAPSGPFPFKFHSHAHLSPFACEPSCSWSMSSYFPISASGRSSRSSRHSRFRSHTRPI